MQTPMALCSANSCMRMPKNAAMTPQWLLIGACDERNAIEEGLAANVKKWRKMVAEAQGKATPRKARKTLLRSIAL